MALPKRIARILRLTRLSFGMRESRSAEGRPVGAIDGAAPVQPYSPERHHTGVIGGGKPTGREVPTTAAPQVQHRGDSVEIRGKVVSENKPGAMLERRKRKRFDRNA